MTDGRYRFEPLGRHHDRAAFSCGVEPLDRYFHQQVGQDQRRGLAVPYVLVEPTAGAVAGYYTLSTFSVVPARLPDALARELPRYQTVPAIFIRPPALGPRHPRQGPGRPL